MCIFTNNIYSNVFLLLRVNQGNGNNSEISDRLLTLKHEIEELEQQEKKLDLHKSWVQQSIKNVTDEVTNTQ